MLTPIQKIMASLAILVFAGQAHALTFAESAHNKNQSTLYGNVGFYGGEIALGVEYETEIEKSHSAGGFFRYFGGNPSAIALAGYIRIHTFKRAWDFYVSPGFGLLNGSSETVLGPNLGFGVKYQFTPRFAAGMDLTTYHYWFGNKTVVAALSGQSTLLATLQFGL